MKSTAPAVKKKLSEAQLYAIHHISAMRGNSAKTNVIKILTAYDRIIEKEMIPDGVGEDQIITILNHVPAMVEELNNHSLPSTGKYFFDYAIEAKHLLVAAYSIAKRIDSLISLPLPALAAKLNSSENGLPVAEQVVVFIKLMDELGYSRAEIKSIVRYWVERIDGCMKFGLGELSASMAEDKFTALSRLLNNEVTRTFRKINEALTALPASGPARKKHLGALLLASEANNVFLVTAIDNIELADLEKKWMGIKPSLLERFEGKTGLEDLIEIFLSMDRAEKKKINVLVHALYAQIQSLRSNKEELRGKFSRLLQALVMARLINPFVMNGEGKSLADSIIDNADYKMVQSLFREPDGSFYSVVASHIYTNLLKICITKRSIECLSSFMEQYFVVPLEEIIFAVLLDFIDQADEESFFLLFSNISRELKTRVVVIVKDGKNLLGCLALNANGVVRNGHALAVNPALETDREKLKFEAELEVKKIYRMLDCFFSIFTLKIQSKFIYNLIVNVDQKDYDSSNFKAKIAQNLLSYVLSNISILSPIADLEMVKQTGIINRKLSKERRKLTGVINLPFYVAILKRYEAGEEAFARQIRASLELADGDEKFPFYFLRAYELFKRLRTKSIEHNHLFSALDLIMGVIFDADVRPEVNIEARNSLKAKFSTILAGGYSADISLETIYYVRHRYLTAIQKLNATNERERNLLVIETTTDGEAVSAWGLWGGDYQRYLQEKKSDAAKSNLDRKLYSYFDSYLSSMNDSIYMQLEFLLSWVNYKPWLIRESEMGLNEYIKSFVVGYLTARNPLLTGLYDFVHKKGLYPASLTLEDFVETSFTMTDSILIEVISCIKVSKSEAAKVLLSYLFFHHYYNQGGKVEGRLKLIFKLLRTIGNLVILELESAGQYAELIDLAASYGFFNGLVETELEYMLLDARCQPSGRFGAINAGKPDPLEAKRDEETSRAELALATRISKKTRQKRRKAPKAVARISATVAAATDGAGLGVDESGEVGSLIGSGKDSVGGLSDTLGYSSPSVVGSSASSNLSEGEERVANDGSACEVMNPDTAAVAVVLTNAHEPLVEISAIRAQASTVLTQVNRMVDAWFFLFKGDIETAAILEQLAARLKLNKKIIRDMAEKLQHLKNKPFEKFSELAPMVEISDLKTRLPDNLNSLRSNLNVLELSLQELSLKLAALAGVDGLPLAFQINCLALAQQVKVPLGVLPATIMPMPVVNAAELISASTQNFNQGYKLLHIKVMQVYATLTAIFQRHQDSGVRLLNEKLLKSQLQCVRNLLAIMTNSHEFINAVCTNPSAEFNFLSDMIAVGDIDCSGIAELSDDKLADEFSAIESSWNLLLNNYCYPLDNALENEWPELSEYQFYNNLLLLMRRLQSFYYKPVVEPLFNKLNAALGDLCAIEQIGTALHGGNNLDVDFRLYWLKSDDTLEQILAMARSRLLAAGFEFDVQIKGERRREHAFPMPWYNLISIGLKGKGSLSGLTDADHLPIDLTIYPGIGVAAGGASVTSQEAFDQRSFQNLDKVMDHACATVELNSNRKIISHCSQYNVLHEHLGAPRDILNEVKQLSMAIKCIVKTWDEIIGKRLDLKFQEDLAAAKKMDNSLQARQRVMTLVTQLINGKAMAESLKKTSPILWDAIALVIEKHFASDRTDVAHQLRSQQIIRFCDYLGIELVIEQQNGLTKAKQMMKLSLNAVGEVVRTEVVTINLAVAILVSQVAAPVTIPTPMVAPPVYPVLAVFPSFFWPNTSTTTIMVAKPASMPVAAFSTASMGLFAMPAAAGSGATAPVLASEAVGNADPLVAMLMAMGLS